MFMSAAATASAPTFPPVTAGWLLGLVRKLIDYGKEIAATLQQRGSNIDLTAVTRPFGTRDIALILARITRGLLLCSALEAKLTQHPACLDARPRKSAAAPSQRQSSNPRPPADRSVETADAILARLPTAEEIAAQVRRRPVGAVIADICRDLGIGWRHQLWQDLHQVMLRFRGNLIALDKVIMDRLYPIPEAYRRQPRPKAALPTPVPPATCAGPP